MSEDLTTVIIVANMVISLISLGVSMTAMVISLRTSKSQLELMRDRWNNTAEEYKATLQKTANIANNFLALSSSLEDDYVNYIASHLAVITDDEGDMVDKWHEDDFNKGDIWIEDIPHNTDVSIYIREDSGWTTILQIARDDSLHERIETRIGSKSKYTR